tara:strand:+ start:2701 stop:2973 length:273 start_codon:yes stop_codon:yes gene_type:complete
MEAVDEITSEIVNDNTLTKKEERRRMYYNLNREREKVKARQYYANNKERFTQPVVCGCLGRYTKLNKTAHSKTRIHMKWVDKQNKQVEQQ